MPVTNPYEESESDCKPAAIPSKKVSKPDSKPAAINRKKVSNQETLIFKEKNIVKAKEAEVRPNSTSFA